MNQLINVIDYKKSIRITIDKLDLIWSEAGIPTCGKKYALKKFEKILEEDKKLQKCSRRRRSATQIKNEAVFHQKLTKLFDIAKVNVEKYLTDEKKLFLSGQRSKSRFGLINNSVGLNPEENPDDAMDVEPVDTNEPEPNVALATQKSAIFRSNLSATTSHVSTDVSDFESQLSQPKQIPKIDVMTPELCAALDRSKVTHRNAIFILAAAYKSVGIDLSTLNLSYSTIYRARNKYRSNITKDLKSEFHKDDRYVVHWDGKILSDIKGSETVEPYCSSLYQFLGLINFSEFKADDGSALKQASAVIDTLNQWEVAPYVKAMCFDTPPVNTGIHKGTCVMIEKSTWQKD
ncbi:uncharacterized protein LOC123264038 [Cotesia glomerata]|uniref:uncharacterized protein LOC123264038 n=1 Tax=Cotesia glomerata TaxID=32391 RepID=UPI001D001B5B|nr:uncharacterized protein LOC123264038 [Cotesia glomerata]